MGLYKCVSSGGSALALGVAPDAVYTKTMNKDATTTITVTKTPRLIIMNIVGTSNYNGMAGFYDISVGDAFKYGYWSNAFHTESWTNVSEYITSVSSRSIGIRNSWGNQCRMLVGVYY